MGTHEFLIKLPNSSTLHLALQDVHIATIVRKFAQTMCSLMTVQAPLTEETHNIPIFKKTPKRLKDLFRLE